MPEIYYAGGTADKSISSQDIIDDICRIKPLGIYFPTKSKLLKELESLLRPGDIIVNMGARDPGLSDFAAKVLTLASKISN
jgi:UDP-N-acetylmuramate--alanine ligase